MQLLVGDSAGGEKFFWPAKATLCSLVAVCLSLAKTIKNLNHSEIYWSLGPDAPVLLRHKWRKKGTLLFSFIFFVNRVASLVGMSFSASFSSFLLKFSRVAVSRKRLQLDSKLIWPGMDWFWIFFGIWLFSSTSYLYKLKFAQHNSWHTVKKTHSIQRCNFSHQHNERKEKCTQCHPFMSEQHLSTRTKTCMHLKKFQIVPIIAGQKHISGTISATNEQVHYWSPIKTATAINSVQTSRDS